MAFGVDAGREVPDLGGQIWCCLVLFLCFLELRWSESDRRWWRETEISVNKVALRGFGGERCVGRILLPVRHGDEWEGELLFASSSRPPHLHQGSMSASRRRSTTAPLSPYSLAVGRPLQPRATRRRGTSAAPESLHALISGVLQQRTQAGGYHRPASAAHGRKATLLVLYFPETKKSEGKINRLRHDTGPSGSSPAPVSVLWRSSSTATFIRCGAELQGPDCFFLFLSGVFFAKAQSLSRISLICRGFSAICNHRFVNISSF